MIPTIGFDLTAVVGEMTGRELHDMLTPVLAHADVIDPDFEPAPHVQIEVVGGVLYLHATDYRTLGIIRHRLTSDPGPIALNVPAESLRTMLRTIKARDQVRLEITDEGVAVFRHDPPSEHHIPAAGGFLINWRERIRTALDGPIQHSQIPIAPALLARFRTATRGDQPLNIRLSHDHTILIACGTHFLGAAAAHLDDPADPMTGWLTDLGLEATPIAENSTTERPARAGEVCTCGHPATVVYVTDNFGEVPYCGTPHPATDIEPAR